MLTCCFYVIFKLDLENINTHKKHILTFLYTFADAVRFLEEIVMVALATAVQEVFAFSPIVVVVPAWKGAFTGSDNWSCSTWIYNNRVIVRWKTNVHFVI